MQYRNPGQKGDDFIIPDILPISPVFKIRPYLQISYNGRDQVKSFL